MKLGRLLGLRRVLQRRRDRERFLEARTGDPLTLANTADYMESWWQDLAAAGLYGLLFPLVYPTAMAYLELGRLGFAVPLFAALVVMGVPVLGLVSEGLTRLAELRRTEKQLEAPRRVPDQIAEFGG